MKRTQKKMARRSLGGLMATRGGSLTLALVCAVCAGGILMMALSQYKTTLKTPVRQATVLVATAQIPKGTSGNTIAAEGLYKSTPIVTSQLAPGAISSASAISGETAVSAILPGQQLTSADFTAQAGVTGLLTPNERAIAINVDEAHGDTDVLQAGDHVDVYSSFQVKTADNSQYTVEVLIAPNVQVIKPAGTSSSTPTQAGGTPITGASLVLAVPAGKASQVAFSADNGKIYLSLRPAEAGATPSVPESIAPIIANSLGMNLNGVLAGYKRAYSHILRDWSASTDGSQ
ncbi:MAG: Flp pilus assembly protein CpaB [Solirubrobacteraceae bacterium]